MFSLFLKFFVIVMCRVIVEALTSIIMIWDSWKNIHMNKKVKHFTRDNNIYHGLANSLPMSMSNANQKYPISTIWIRMTLSKPHNAHNSHKQHLQISPTYSKPLFLQTQTHNSKVPIHPKTL